MAVVIGNSVRKIRCVDVKDPSGYQFLGFGLFRYFILHHRNAGGMAVGLGTEERRVNDYADRTGEAADF